MPTTSLIVTTYNWPEALALCLASVARQRVQPDEVIIADDGSRGDTAKMIARQTGTFPVPLCHAWQRDLGFRAARVRNLATAASRGEYVIFIDGDMVLHDRFVEDQRALAVRGVYLQGGRLNTSEAESARLISGGTPRFAPWMPMAPHVHGELKPKHAVRIPPLARRKLRGTRQSTVMSCHMGVWRRDLDAVNGFDDAYVGWGREDNDLALRLGHAGIEQRTVRFAALALHLWHRTRWPGGVLPAQQTALPNDTLLNRAAARRSIACEHGLSQHVARLRGSDATPDEDDRITWIVPRPGKAT